MLHCEIGGGGGGRQVPTERWLMNPTDSLVGDRFNDILVPLPIQERCILHAVRLS